MISIVNTHDDSGRLLELFDDLLNLLPPGTATLESMRTEKDDGTIIRLKPANQRAAEFGAHIEDGGLSLIDVFFGGGTTFELPWEAKLPESADIDAILGIVRGLGLAVIAGRCEERFGLLGVRGKIQVDETNVYRSTHYFYPRLYPKTVQYEPFCPGASKS